ncbi:MAG: hypothetical protein HYW07_23735 [Candidatus Latescibacteria bacterium]|nr:hypothetical protein [Candidatus Latescibacterota bacterium]
MATKRQIADMLRGRLADVAERGRVLGQALGVRADMAATRRRLRAALADLGEEVHTRLRAGQEQGLAAEVRVRALQDQVDGLKAELRLQEMELRRIMQEGLKRGDRPEAAPGPSPLRPDVEGEG